MCFEDLKQKASGLPLAPGVYIMRDKSNNVIYVGKAKKLKNRVSQYFQDTASHSPKTRMMVSKIDHFEVIIAASEFEALVLESSLIKRHQPKYNILLKDDKGYPYLKVGSTELYPRIQLVGKISDDGADYYGPFGSRGITHDLLETVTTTLKLPNCAREFPRDIGKDRPCLNYHMKQCDGWCRGTLTNKDYIDRIEQAKQLLQGNFKQVSNQIKEEMLNASDALNFELAANLRDRLKAVEALGQRQLVTAGNLADTDVIGFYQNQTRACFAVLHFSGGNLLDKEYEIVDTVEDSQAAVAYLITQFYLNKGFSPKHILLPFHLEDKDLLEQLFEQKLGKRPKLRVPQRGDNVKLIALASINAKEEVERITSKDERTKGVLSLLEKMLNLSELKRIEAYDISNISGTDIVAGMVVFVNGRPKKGEDKRFALRDLEDQNDYASMHQVIHRRFSRYLNSDEGFSQKPDMLLIDGGVNHAKIAESALSELNLTIPVFGMVKDDRHRTRALVTANGLEISIEAQQSVFSFIGSIQEETHRFAISYHRKLRSKRIQYSELDKIPGIGPKRKQELLKRFKSLSNIKEASPEELSKVLPMDVANNVYNHFNRGENN